ncbi:hypothetical protein APY04_0304 [Hyphomicrobium sulfonivorans]|uniref:DUF2062 domain-containing protein n=1 Tax=Hyphomicrobium sulfonivorans TaxID=121290 RepID=A0A109BNE4_HYPSL|nr:DUF2062 domain-containing protein [Hyphomicrobium sulfonivorans]KWT72021.1 hypothetical protein APY04_0304 [Hyphomicrobium sulfonivorans]
MEKSRPHNLTERSGALLAPFKEWGWLQGARDSIRRMLQQRATAHEIALGCALGAFVSITPLLGVQTLMAIVMAFVLRASVPAAIVGTFIGNPLSWPFIWVSTYLMGLQMVGLEGAFDAAAVQRNIELLGNALLDPSPQLLDATAALFWPLLWPMLAGSLPIGLLTAAVVYYVSRNSVRAWRSRHMASGTAASE